MNESTNSLFSAAMATLGMVLSEFYSHLTPWLMLGMVLVFVDLRFGVLASKARGEKIRISRMWRRTFNKMVDYLCWVTLAEVCSRTFGMTIGSPVVSMTMLFIIYGIEINSCINNYLEYKGVKGNFDIWKILNRSNPINDDVNNEKSDERKENGNERKQ